MYRYYLRLRPAMPGTIPTKSLDRIENYDYRRFDEDAGEDVWGYVEYTEPLTDKEIDKYELVERGMKDEDA